MNRNPTLALCAAGLFLVPWALAGQVSKSHGLVMDGATMAPVDGSATTLSRTSNGVVYHISTAALGPGHAYSVWVGIEDTDGDLFMFHGGGAPSNAHGEAILNGHISAGVMGLMDGETVLFNLNQASGGAVGNGAFDDPAGADVICILRDHGPLLPGQQQVQFGGFNGGCEQYDCEDVQLALFELP